MISRRRTWRLRRPMTMVVAIAEIIWTLGIVVPAQPAFAAQVIQNLATSSSPSLQTRWYSLRGYGSIPKWELNWPQRSENCPFNGKTYKTLPWQAYDPFNLFFNGNYMDISSNCADRYTDAGTAIGGGAWIYPSAQGGWAMPGGPQFINWQSGAFPAFSTVMNGCFNGSLPGGNAAAIWGAAGPDTSDQFYASGPIGTIPGFANGLYYDNYPGGIPQATKLFSNGVTLVRDSFNLNATDMIRLNQGSTSLFMQAYADDWLQVYLNGVAVGAYTTTTASRMSLDLTAVKGLLVPGQNWIGVMAADKAVFDAADPGGRGAGVCYNLQYKYSDAISNPGLQGLNSDIHAGGGLCGQALSGGNVTTSPNNPPNPPVSYGQYVVSATGSINNLFSNNANSGVNDKLKAGSSGGYAQVCRADLLTAARAGWPSGPGIHTIGGLGAASFNLTGTESGVYYFNGTHLNLHGAVGNPVAPGVPPSPVTIVTLNPAAVVEIDGNITLNNTVYPPHSAPSLGIISASDILIDPAVTHVDAYLFSSAGTIYTCNAAPSACSTPLLTVNGFLMAKDLSFGRVGPFNTMGSPITESIVMTPQIYLNPPKYFDVSVDDAVLQGQGEKPPLF